MGTRSMAGPEESNNNLQACNQERVGLEISLKNEICDSLCNIASLSLPNYSSPVQTAPSQNETRHPGLFLKCIKIPFTICSFGVVSFTIEFVYCIKCKKMHKIWQKSLHLSPMAVPFHPWLSSIHKTSCRHCSIVLHIVSGPFSAGADNASGPYIFIHNWCTSGTVVGNVYSFGICVNVMIYNCSLLTGSWIKAGVRVSPSDKITNDGIPGNLNAHLRKFLWLIQDGPSSKVVFYCIVWGRNQV